jgi:hypothetical protein
MPQGAAPPEDFAKRLWRSVFQARRMAGDTIPVAMRKASAVLGGTPMDPAQKGLAYIVKTQPELRTVWGWASVIEEAGQPVVDLQGDVITEPDLVAAAHRFAAVRTIKAMHQGEPIGELVESLVLTKSLQQALGVDLGLVGWIIGARITHDDAWAAVKAGHLPAFSIGGTGVRVAHDS